ncbi:MAG: serine/threonine-protein phosphatase [Bacteroides sp.]|nr:serine/threonine-protein phosphatase [Bacteroides sp.]
MKYIIKPYSIWEFGKRKDTSGRPHQEDSIYPAFHKETESDRLFILCDGMGGHDAGEIASATVCEAMSKSVLNDGHDAEGIFNNDDFSRALAAAFEALDKKDNGAEKKMGTTMTFLKLHNDGVTIAHIGDSRVYHIRPGKTGQDTKILFVTEDHSLVNDLIKIGELTREEARLSNQKNIITKAMQPKMNSRPKADIYHTTDIQPGDYFYMCSDGMLEQFDMESGESIRNIFSEQGGNDEQKVYILAGATNDNRDNHTAFIIHIIDVIDPIISKNNNSEQKLSEKMILSERNVSKASLNIASDSNKSVDNRDHSKNILFIILLVVVALIVLSFLIF